MGCGNEKLSKYLTQTFTAHCNAMICQQVTLSGDAEWPKVADAVIEADIPISNCINSEIHRIYVLTQFNSASLNRHIARTYALAGAGFSQGFVEVLAAQQTPDSPSWFGGTADAVRQYLEVLAEWDVDQYLILSGDHLYRMHYADFIRYHRETKADLTIG